MRQKPHTNCAECPLRDAPYVPSCGSGDLLVIGEAPGKEEASAGEPFVGGSGRLLRYLLRDAMGLGEDQPLPVQFANTVACRPPGNRTPTVEEVVRCGPVLEQVLSARRWRAVLAVGKVSLERLVGPDLVRRILASRASWDGYFYHAPSTPILAGVYTYWQGAYYKTGPRKGDPKLEPGPGFVRSSALGSVPIIASLHPAAVLRTGFAALARLGLPIRRCVAVWKEGYQGVYAGPASPASRCSARALAGVEGATASAISFDIENPDRGRISQIGFASSNGHVCSAPWDTSTKVEARRVLTEGTYELIAHNAQYDVAHLELEGIEVDESRLRDTMLAAQLLQPDLPKALGSVAPRYLDMHPWKHNADHNLAHYNATDADVTLKIWQKMRKELEDNGQLEFFEQALMPGSMVLRRLTRDGIRVSSTTQEIWKHRLQLELQDLQDQWSELTNGVNPASAKQLAEYFYEREELAVVEKTPGGAPSTSAAALAKLARRTDHPALRLLVEIRQRAKQLGTYAKDQGVGPDGCVHPQYLPAGKDDGAFGTASLRLAARNPNIQNQPPQARFMYVPHRPGWVIGESDFSQIEGRLVAFYSGDEQLLRGYANGDDLHQQNADLWGVPRKKAKNILYAMSYGARARRLAQQFEVRQSVAQGWLDAYAKAHPAVWAWQNEMIRRASTYSYLQNPFGIRRYFPGLAADDSHVRNQALNFMPQSTVAAITWHLLAPIYQMVEEAGGYLLTQVHDSFVWEAPAARAEEIAELVRGIMEQPWPQLGGWSCPTDVSVGETWGHAGENEKEGNGDTGLQVWIQKGRPALSEV